MTEHTPAWPDIGARVRITSGFYAGNAGTVRSVDASAPFPLYITSLKWAQRFLPSQIEVIGTIRVLSSGRHQFQNWCPWAQIETDPETGQEYVSNRFASRKEAEAYTAAHGTGWSGWTAEGGRMSAGPTKIEWDPNVAVDGRPLFNPGNPILAEVRDEDGVSRAAVKAWHRETGEWISEGDPGPHVFHAHKVLDLYLRIFPAQ